jgi:hypothetical protein
VTQSRWGITPRLSIEAECARRSRDEVVTGCIRLLSGGEVDPDLLVALGGPGADKFLDGQAHEDTYWLRVWGARGLLWAWDDRALDTVVAATADESWRVRELACKVVARHLLGDALPSVAALRDDPVPRVRTAATRAVTALTGAGA